MNYLAHFHLSDGDDELLLGALLGDFVKGPLSGQRNLRLEQGIMLHRNIDAFTDRHPGLREAHQLFSPEYRRYAGIMTDVAFDHFLNRHWQTFHSQPLPQFSRRIYQLLAQNRHLTGAARRQAEVLIRHQVFEQYRHWRTVAVALEKIGLRIRRDNPLASAADEMQHHYASLEDYFLDFYPQLQQHVKQLRAAFTA